MDTIRTFERAFAQQQQQQPQQPQPNPQPPPQPQPQPSHPQLQQTTHPPPNATADLDDDSLLDFDLDGAVAAHYSRQTAAGVAMPPPPTQRPPLEGPGAGPSASMHAGLPGGHGARGAARRPFGTAGGVAAAPWSSGPPDVASRLEEQSRARVRAFLDYAEQLRSEREACISRDNADALTLSTIHGSKGTRGLSPGQLGWGRGSKLMPSGSHLDAPVARPPHAPPTSVVGHDHYPHHQHASHGASCCFRPRVATRVPRADERRRVPDRGRGGRGSRRGAAAGLRGVHSRQGTRCSR